MRPGTFVEVGRHHVVTAPFVDFDGVEHPRGEVFRVDDQSFSPYDEGHTLRVSGPDGARWLLRLCDIPGSSGLRFAALGAHLGQAPPAPEVGGVRPPEHRLARARIAALVATADSQVPLEDLAGEVERWNLAPHLRPEERAWLEGRQELPVDASYWVERAVAGAWTLGLVDRFRDLDGDSAQELSARLLLDAPSSAEAPSTEKIMAQLAWCAALVELRAIESAVLAGVDERALRHHRAALLEAFEDPLGAS